MDVPFAIYKAIVVFALMLITVNVEFCKYQQPKIDLNFKSILSVQNFELIDENMWLCPIGDEMLRRRGIYIFWIYVKMEEESMFSK